MRIVIDLEAAQSPLSRNRGIGRYSIALAKGMLRQRGGHEILIALNGAYAGTVEEVRRDFDGLLPQTSILTWLPSDPPFAPESAGQRAAMAAVRSAFFASLNADIVHVASPFDFSEYAFGTIGVNPEPHRTAVTLYDLIPHIYADIYLHPTGSAPVYYERVENLKRADLWLAISESSRQEGIEHAKLPAERVVNISSAVDEHFTPGTMPVEYEVSLRVQYGLWRPFVMYTGGIDHRKNIEGLIAAWAALPAELRGAHQLAIVCSVHPVDRARLEALVHDVGLASGEVVFTGYVPEEHLLNLYRLCKLFVFPSLHEGFGLPALEAMSCGAPVIGSDNSSIPEVIGRADAMFDARSREAITGKIRQCLEDAAFRAELAHYGPQQARRFSWDRSARMALDAMESLPARPREGLVPAGRPKLAYVSPLPPEHSGIASYSAELIPALAQHYDIDLVVAQDKVEGLPPASFGAIRGAAWFLQHGQEYDRVLYHFGNSHYHEYMLPLLRRHPGTVVLHDFFLSGMQANREFVTEKQRVWTQALYDSHGWRALLAREKATDMTGPILEFPANFEVLRDAQGVIVHSPYSMQLAREWYGPAAADGWKLIPHLRVPLPLRRDDARGELGYGEQDFVVCSFGLLGPTKMNDRLLRAWAASSLAADPHCHLVFVGENVSGKEYGRTLQELSAAAGGRVTITGWAGDDVFRQYLNAADVAVQLRTLSRGETSGTVLDAMNHGVPVIANANGSMAYLPRDAALVLDEEFTDEQLARALETLRNDEAKRRAMGEAARRQIETRHSPADCAAAYRDAIEAFAAGPAESRAGLTRRVAALLGEAPAERVVAGIASAIAHDLPSAAPARQLLADVGEYMAEGEPPLPQLLEDLAVSPYPGWRAEPVYRAEDGRWRYARKFMLQHYGCNPQLLQDDVVEMRRGDAWMLFPGCTVPQAAADAAVMPIELADEGDAATAWSYVAMAAQPPQHPRCYVDISELLRHDWQSGIQRVVKNHLSELLRRPPPGQVVVPVYTEPSRPGYRVAAAFLRQLAQLPVLPDEKGRDIEPQDGDTFFALDLQPHFVAENAPYLAGLQSQGVRVVFMVYDLLPVRLPDCFFPGAAEHHVNWLRIVANADMAVCISQSVARDLREWLAANVPGAPLRDIRFVHLGADLGTRLSTRGLPESAEQVLSRIREHPSFLMVGTVEPRKSHAQVLDAFEVLWERGSDAMLVISGRPGWMTEALVARVRAHAELGKRLLWIEDASDEFVERLYESCSALILASRGEGFGLPLVEAAQRGLPIIARDLPVFREVAGDHAFYFDDDAPQPLADAIAKWLGLREQGTQPQSRGMPWLTWSQSAAQLRRILERP